ncbi:glycosyl transferase family 1, partial [Vibrio parahaemolyticus]
AGIPVLATDFPEIRKIVTSFEIGQVVKGQSYHALADTLRLMLNNPEQLNKYRNNAIKYRENLCWEEQEHKLVNLYRSILGE